MISLVKRTLQIFSGLSIGSAIPFIPSLVGEKEEIKLSKGSDRTASNDQREEPRKVEEVTENVMLRATQKMEESGKTGEKGCFWLFGDKKWLELFMCTEKKTLSIPSLFYYARNDKSVPKEKKLNEVVEITKDGTSFWKMTFDNDVTKEMPRYLSISFGWLSKWNTNLMPKTHCKVEKSDSIKEHTLTCDNPNKKYGEKAFTKKVSPEPPRESRLREH